MIRELILGSQSPRRKELLAGAGFTFEIIKPDVEEVFSPEMNVYEVPEFLARLKNEAIREIVGGDTRPILTADTVVILDEQIIGKPDDEEHACEILAKLSGKMHEVVTGVCISSSEREETFSDTTRVFFNVLTAEEIRLYVQKYQPFDKAGSYAIQEWIGYVGVSRVEGCFYNVMGLPIPKVYHLLRDWKP